MSNLEDPNPPVDCTSYQYTRLDYVKDAVAGVILMGSIFIMIWIAFAMDVITTGM
jgi:hypothetical protein